MSVSSKLRSILIKKVMPVKPSKPNGIPNTTLSMSPHLLMVAVCSIAPIIPKPPLHITVHGMQQQLQSSVLMHEHFPPWGLTIEPAVEEMELVAAGIFANDIASKFEDRGFEYVGVVAQSCADCRGNAL